MCQQGVLGELGEKTLTLSKGVYHGKDVYMLHARKTCESLSLTVVSYLKSFAVTG